MLVNPRFLAFLLATAIAILVTAFLSFLPEATANVIFISFIATMIIGGFLIYFALDYLVFQEVNKLYDTINRLKTKDFSLISKKKLYRNANPIKKLNDELFVYVAKKEQEVNELRRLEKFRREFLADVSHELKTPIFAAQGFVHTLLDGAMNDERVNEKFLMKAAKSLDGLDALVKDLLTLSQMEIGDIKMNKERVDIQAMTKEIFEQLEGKIKDRNVTVKITAPTEKTYVSADNQRISQVMTNLIDNAIKYGKEDGKVVVSFEDDKKHWLISVKDNGAGIGPEHLNRIFERFYRIEKSRSKDKGGTGLGLAIVKHIVQAHKSKISVMSKPDKGTTFSFKLDKAD
ncbi:two-component system, OmpR family, phosphate regulon sensor histidine kinase PhoR [Pseudarcicella hirudinis]|uniref:histidine kinase n=1 Tax=Pseudarcicella hirudinis TaxID=1079859 RepID=A0A1I5Q6Y3_9BACT|nr:ATP-binding protein [Pseudarcicella hirudinis]SFP42108.1 two-component system, OmpR family, phosphate regulon sensor histidine kinase PhoR [Pseudarcicella hirudinis]